MLTKWTQQQLGSINLPRGLQDEKENRTESERFLQGTGMGVIRYEAMAIRSGEDLIGVRQVVRQWAVALGFSLVEQTKVVTAASEIARNTLIHGGGGTVLLEALNDQNRRGFRLTFEDRGPGIVDVEQALKDGYTTGSGLGLGLGGAKRLSNVFEIRSRPGEGTRVSLTRWK